MDAKRFDAFSRLVGTQIDRRGALWTVAAGALGTKTGRGFHDWTQRDAGALLRRRDEELVRRLRLLAGGREELTA